jgi:hypothetical protein
VAAMSLDDAESGIARRNRDTRRFGKLPSPALCDLLHGIPEFILSLRTFGCHRRGTSWVLRLSARRGQSRQYSGAALSLTRSGSGLRPFVIAGSAFYARALLRQRIRDCTFTPFGVEFSRVFHRKPARPREEERRHLEHCARFMMDASIGTSPDHLQFYVQRMSRQNPVKGFIIPSKAGA